MMMLNPKYTLQNFTYRALLCLWRHRHGHLCYPPQTWRPFSGADNRLHLPHRGWPLHDGMDLLLLFIVHTCDKWKDFSVGCDEGRLYTPTFFMCLTWKCYCFFVGKNCLCQCSKWPVRHGSDGVWQHVDASGRQQQNVRKGKKHVC